MLLGYFVMDSYCFGNIPFKLDSTSNFYSGLRNLLEIVRCKRFYFRLLTACLINSKSFGKSKQVFITYPIFSTLFDFRKNIISKDIPSLFYSIIAYTFSEIPYSKIISTFFWQNNYCPRVKLFMSFTFGLSFSWM